MAIETTVEVKDKVTHLQHLQDELEVLKNRYERTNLGSYKTSIEVLEDRVKELSAWVVHNY